MTADSGGDSPLAGLRVVEIDSPLTAYAGRLLWELGADVVLVEPRAGSPMRALAHGAAFAHYHAGKQVVALEPREPQDRARLVELVDHADVLVEAPASETLGHRNADRETRDDLVHVVLTPYGATGPRAAWRASDLVVSALGGVAAQVGWPDAPPQVPPADQAWHLAGLNGVIGALLALAERARSGRGQQVEVSALECVAASLEAGALLYIHADGVARRTGSSHPIAPHRLFAAADGWVAGGLGGNPRMWAGLLDWMDETGQTADLRSEMMRDPARLAENREHVFAVIEAFTRTLPRHAFFHEAQRRRLPWAAVLDVEEVANCPQLLARGALVPISFDGYSGLDVVPPIHRRDAVRSAPPTGSPSPAALWGPTVARSESAGDGPRPRRGSLDDVVVLDLTWVLAGPYATRVLADHGAHVIKIESRHRPDPTRFSQFMHLSRGEFDPDTSGYFNNVNRNKRSITLNLRKAEGVETLLRLAERADVVIENFSAGALDRMGIGTEVLQAGNPRLIVVSMSGLGGTGPWCDYVTYADAVTALSGLTALALDRTHSAPIVHGFADIVAGLQAALATLAALIDRRRTGSGCVIDLSELEAVAAQIGPGLLELAATGTHEQRRTVAAAPEGVYRCLGPDRWVAITVPDDAAWQALCAVIGRGDLTSDDRFATAARRAKHMPEVHAAITAWTAPRAAEDVAERLQAVGVPSGAVQDGRDLVEHDPQLRARGFYRVLEHPRAGPFLHEGIPIRLSLTPGDLWDPAPLLGADTDAVLETLGGFTPNEIAALHATGALE